MKIQILELLTLIKKISVDYASKLVDKLENIKKIAEALDITPAYLMGWDKEESLSNTVSKNIKSKF